MVDGGGHFCLVKYVFVINEIDQKLYMCYFGQHQKHTPWTSYRYVYRVWEIMGNRTEVKFSIQDLRKGTQIYNYYTEPSDVCMYVCVSKTFSMYCIFLLNYV